MSIMMEAARDQVTATIAGKQRKISKIQATAMQLATKAAGGDPASIGRFLDWWTSSRVALLQRNQKNFPSATLI